MEIEVAMALYGDATTQSTPLFNMPGKHGFMVNYNNIPAVEAMRRPCPGLPAQNHVQFSRRIELGTAIVIPAAGYMKAFVRRDKNWYRKAALFTEGGACPAGGVTMLPPPHGVE